MGEQTPAQRVQQIFDETIADLLSERRKHWEWRVMAFVLASKIRAYLAVDGSGPTFDAQAMDAARGEIRRALAEYDAIMLMAGSPKDISSAPRGSSPVD